MPYGTFGKSEGEDPAAEPMEGKSAIAPSKSDKNSCCQNCLSVPGDELHPENKPREFNVNFRGPMDDRSCTDVICLVLFILCLLGQVVVAYFAFSRGNPEILLAPIDSTGHICGKPPFENKTKLFYFDLLACAQMGPIVAVVGCNTPQVCVSSCPSTNWAVASLAAEEALAGKPLPAKREAELICLSDFDAGASNMSVMDLAAKKYCASYYIESKALLNHCMPKFLVDGINTVGALVDKTGKQLINNQNMTLTSDNLLIGNQAMMLFLRSAQTAQVVVKDILNSGYWIIALLVVAALVTLIYCVTLRFCVSCVVWFTLIAFFLLFAGSSAYCGYQYHFVANNSANGKFIISKDLTDYTSLKEFWLGLAISTAILTAIVLVVLIFLRNQLRLAVGIFCETSKAIAAIPFSLISPIIPCLLELGVVAMWLAITIYLAAVGKKMFSKIEVPTLPDLLDSQSKFRQSLIPPQNITIEPCTPVNLSDPITALHCQFVRYAGQPWAYYLQAYNLFIAFWLFVFCSGFCQIVLAGAYSSWYWAWEKPRDVPTFPLLSSLFRSLRYHIGTVAFGSLLIAITMMIRAIIMALQSRVKGRGSCCARFILCLCACCFWCIEKCLRFITKNAYIVTAVLGKSFCPAAANAFFLILRNFLRVGVLNGVTAYILFIGKIVITAANCALAYSLLSGKFNLGPNVTLPVLTYIWVPIVIVGVGTYAITCLFFSVFSFGIDTLFFCVMEDLERNDGSPEKPYFMSKKLMQVLDVNNKFRDKDAKNYNSSKCCCMPCC